MLKSVMLAVIVDRILSKMGVRMKSEERDILAKICLWLMGKLLI